MKFNILFRMRGILISVMLMLQLIAFYEKVYSQQESKPNILYINADDLGLMDV